MKRKEPNHPRGPRDVYDPHADESTTPDIVPAALRFAEDSEPSSGFVHRRPELAPYSDWRATSETRDEPTVADVPFPKSPRVPSEDLVREVPRSETRHRTPRTAPAAIAVEPAPYPEAQREERRRRSERVHAHAWVPPVAQQNRPLKVLFVVSLTTAAVVAFSTSLADGSLKRVADRIVSSFSEREETPPPPPLETSAPPRVLVRPASPRQAPSAAAPEVPMVRAEDLPLLKQDERAPKPRRQGSGLRRRTP